MSTTDPVLYIFFGLIASGKSTLSSLFAQKYGCPCYNTDRVRKELAGIAASDHRQDGMEKGIYTPEFTAKTYQIMLGRAAEDIRQGESAVILDGSYSKLVDRRQMMDLAETLGAKTFFVLCTCSDQEVRRRLELRAKDPDAVSDGRWDIFVKQKKAFEFPGELGQDQLLELNTENPPEQLLKKVERFCINRP